jgi:uncharacterized coiled-coil protein SlyX
MKEEALNIALMLKTLRTNPNNGEVTFSVEAIKQVEDTIRRLVEELDNKEHFNKENSVKEVFNNEPVAWIYERPNGSAKLVWVREPHDKSIIKEIPLYRTPQDQADRIAELEKQVKDIHANGAKVIDNLDKIIMCQAKQIEMLQNGTPYCWEYVVNGVHKQYSDELPPDDAYDKGTLVPLYTTPQTKLTDEKILKIAEKIFHYTEYKLAIEFARIVRGEK